MRTKSSPSSTRGEVVKNKTMRAYKLSCVDDDHGATVDAALKGGAEQ